MLSPYINTREGWLCLATVIDLGSRKVVGWATADHLRTDQAEQALRNAVTQRRPGPGVIFQSGRGCQYTSGQYARAATDAGVRLSVGRKGRCRDNAVAESFFDTIKTELLDRQPSPTKAKAHKAIFEYGSSGSVTCESSSSEDLGQAVEDGARVGGAVVPRRPAEPDPRHRRTHRRRPRLAQAGPLAHAGHRWRRPSMTRSIMR